jgi:DNA/RNA endonuclease YhcR with UshA esterase domain
MKAPLLITLVITSIVGTVRAQEASAIPVEAAPAAAEAPAVVQAEDTAALESKLGSEVIVEGFVKDVGQTSGGGITFINFGDRKTGFTAVVFRSSLDNFPEGLDKYSNQKVRVRGTLEKYQDRQLQVKVSTPDQLEIVSVAP